MGIKYSKRIYSSKCNAYFKRRILWKKLSFLENQIVRFFFLFRKKAKIHGGVSIILKYLSIDWHVPVPAKCVEIDPEAAILPLNMPITTAADDIHKYVFIEFQRK